MAWTLWGLVGVLPWLAFFVFVWLGWGYSTRRLVWPELSYVESASDAQERLLAPRMNANKTFYGPMLASALVGGALVSAELGPVGLAIVTCLATPPLLSLVATARVYLLVRELRRTARGA
jgi:hypothetical protein